VAVSSLISARSITAIIVFITTTWLQGPLTIKRLDSLWPWFGHVVLFGYLPALSMWIGIVNLMRRRRPASGGEAPI
jgi:hypothetical protein